MVQADADRRVLLGGHVGDVTECGLVGENTEMGFALPYVASTNLGHANDGIFPRPEAVHVVGQRPTMRSQAGQDEAAAEALRQAGPQPLMALDPVLVGVLEEAVVIEVRGASQGRLDVTRGDGDWRLDLATGLARRGPQEDPNSPSVWARDPSPRGRPDLCPGSSSGWVWTSPAEGLSSGLAGVYRFRSGEVTRLAITPPGAVDISPACLGDRVWFVRRLGEHAEVLRVEGGSVKPLSTGDAGVATVDVRENPRGQPELVLGLVVEGSPGVYWIPGGESTPQLLLVAQQPLLAPRWVD